MAQFFTSDWHLNSTEIIRYAHRPFENAGIMNAALIDNCNKAVYFYDTVFHVGDLLLSGKDRHDDVVDDAKRCLTCRVDRVEALRNNIVSRFITLAGNHDDSHNAETDMKSMVIDLNHNYRNVYVSHFPSNHPFYHGPRHIAADEKVNVVLCGHVHDKWLYMWDVDKHVLNINVGVDVWNYKPVSAVELTELLDLLLGKKYAGVGINLLKMKMHCHKNYASTRQEHDAFVVEVKKKIEQRRQKRKEERYKKKGLTPEECERRKQAGIAAWKAKLKIK